MIEEREGPLPEQTIAQWQKVVEVLARSLEVPSAIITHAMPPRIEVLQGNDAPENPYRAGMEADLTGLYCEEVLRTRSKLAVSDARRIKRWQQAPELEQGMISYLGLPIHWPDGSLFGTICLHDRRENPFGQRYEDVLGQFRDLVEAHIELFCKNRQLERTLREVDTLRGIIPICAKCKKIRNDEGFWQQVEQYISMHSEAKFSHGLCPTCIGELYYGQGSSPEARV